MKKKSKFVLASVFVIFSFIGTAIYFWFPHSATAAYECIDNLRMIDGAIQQWALEHRASSNAIPTWNDVLDYSGRQRIKVLPQCPSGGTYTIRRVTDAPTCSFPGHNMEVGYYSVRVEEETSLRGSRYWDGVPGAMVVAQDESGRRTKARTDENGYVTVKTWPKKIVVIFGSKDGYTTSSNTSPWGPLRLKKIN